MDDLDRLFRRLVQNIRNGYPEYLTRPFEVSELFQNLVPYRHNRRELEIDSNQDYEMALCQLLAGERGFVVSEDPLREVVRKEISSPNPNTAVFREFAASRVKLVPDALRRYDAMTTETPAPSVANPPIPPVPSSAPRETASAADPRESAHLAGAQPRSAQHQGAQEQSAHQQGTQTQSASPPFRPASAAASPTKASGAAPGADATPGAGTVTVAGSTRSNRGTPAACRYCGGHLPLGRRVTYCPHCGQNLTIQRCPACSSELELGWKFCVTCGRGVG